MRGSSSAPAPCPTVATLPEGYGTHVEDLLERIGHRAAGPTTVGVVRLQLTARTGHPDFLDLPWEVPLANWDDPRIVEVTRGIHRHVVRFVNLDGTIYALKELPGRLAQREYRLLRHLEEESLPVVEVVGVVGGRADRDGRPLEAVLITQHLDFALPYRVLFVRGGMRDLQDHLLDALAGLLVRLHLVGFFWGDCSLSNALFRRDAGSLAAYLVDAETGELHDELTSGQRAHDLEIARMNIAGELFDVQAEHGVEEIDPVDVADEIGPRYEGLWSELVRAEVFAPDERYRISERLRRINELGFDVDEVELVTTGEGVELKLQTHVVEPGHHRRRLMGLTGLDVQENQARRLLNDIAQYRAHLADQHGEEMPVPVVAHRWMNDVFEPVLAMVPDDLRGKREPAELFHEILEHKYLRSLDVAQDVGLEEAVRSYVHEVLPERPDEHRLLIERGET
ncbi:MAG: DUF4032 domain-containing protein [Actinobacteria bacterium]|nr:DUF4032 domain-containing protein [Actinomycetota bacterium]